MSSMEELRAQGNALFAAKDFAAAVATYSKGLALKEEDAAEDARHRVLLWSNRAACYLQTKQPELALDDCSQVLALEPQNEKARYRRAQAHVAMGNFTPAFQDVRFVLQLNPGNKAAATLARQISDAVHEDVHGVQKALDSIASGIESGIDSLVAQQQRTQEALVFLERKCAADSVSLPREVDKKGGVFVLWRMVVALLGLLKDAQDKHDNVLTVLSHVVGLLAVVASASKDLALKIHECGAKESALKRLVELLHAQVASEYEANSTVAKMPLVGRKNIIKLCAFLFKQLMLSTDDDAQIRLVLSGLLDGLRSRERELQISALDGVLHFVASAGSSSTPQPSEEDQSHVAQRKQHFATLAQEMGLFSLFHGVASHALEQLGAVQTGTTDVLLSRLPLVFTQCLAQLEAQENALKQLVREFCVSPVLIARASDRTQVFAGTASCLLLSALFLSNAKLALWAVQQTGNDGTAFLARVYDFLLASRSSGNAITESTEGGVAQRRHLQAIWVDCVASVCGVEHGTVCVPAPLRVEIYKLLRAALDDEDLVLRASALSIQVKIAVVEKTFEIESEDGQFLLHTVFEVLEHAHAYETAAELSPAKNRELFWSGASPKERGIEALSYLITLTPVKEAFSRRPKAITSVFHVDFAASSSSTPEHHAHVGYRSNVYYGIGYILHHVLTAESSLKKKQMEGMELTPDQYEELQKALKQKSALDDGDSPEMVHARVVKLALGKQTHVLTTLVQLLKYATTRSQNVVEMAALSALHAAEVPEVRGTLVQSGILQALLPLSLPPAKANKNKQQQNQPAPATPISNASGHAIAKILISTNPNLLPSAALFSCIKPLLDLCKRETQLLQFEALMALTNIASVSEQTKERIVMEPQGLSTLQYLQFSEHELVRRAATETICNLLPNEQVLEKIFMNEEKIRLWLALASVEEEQEDFETARAASGALAMVSQVPAVSWLLLKHGGLVAFTRVVLDDSAHQETVHRALFALENMIETLRSENTPEKSEEREELLEALKTTHAGSLSPKLQALAAGKISATPPPVQEAARSCLGALLQALR